ncbi:CatB-related O-acetyltransferase [Coprococcus sp. AF21-14LB]|uniref:CatB-related O-acetyltransferase n=1 Tax=Coprococcus sp. AF21-14LB TaxID=2292231 RepID=UPI000E539868|nr:CatB-related O-acetyltransferase [Coprococcus sp. AF21-14LB]RGS74952.1 antibiotic acetyltransferase [Coprococcus sp. AF21-14LB]
MTFIKTMLKKFYYMCKFKKKNVTLCRGCNIDRGSFFEGNNVIGSGTHFKGTLGYGSYIGNNSEINGKIGKYCSIANNVHVIMGMHPTEIYVSTHPCFFSNKCQAGFTYTSSNTYIEQKYADNEKNPVVIGNDVWIGFGVSIMSGISIGDGAIIGAGTLVTHDVEPYTIVVGIPGKVLKKRFTDKEIEFLLNFKWWDKTEDWLKSNVQDFNDISKFIMKNNIGDKKYGEKK